MLLNRLSHDTIAKWARFPAIVIPVIFISIEMFLGQGSVLEFGPITFSLIILVWWSALQTQYMLQMSQRKMRRKIIYDVALVVLSLGFVIFGYLQHIGYQIGNDYLVSLVMISLVCYSISVPASLLSSLHKECEPMTFLFYFVLFFGGIIFSPFIQRFIKKIDFQKFSKTQEISLP